MYRYSYAALHGCSRTQVQRYLLEVGEYVLNLDLNCQSGVCLGWVQLYEYRFTKFKDKGIQFRPSMQSYQNLESAKFRLSQDLNRVGRILQ